MRAASAALRAEGEAEAAPAKEGFFAKYTVVIYIALWYIFNIGYNIYNKTALNIYPFPWAVALWQMAFGWLIFVPLWLFGIRKTPKLTVKQAITLSPAALGHLATHVGAVVAFFAGAVSFGHIVKASEPVVSSILNAVFLGEVLAWPVYAALTPIIFGVALASASELSFTWLCFGAAMGSNLGSAARAVYSKKVMAGGNIGENMDSANTYAVLTIMATFMLLPIALAIEGPSAMLKGFAAAKAGAGMPFLLAMLYSGLTYYMYNEVAFLALGKLDPVSHAVCNAMKRVVIIIAAIIVFRTPVTGLGIAGSCIAIAGTLLYSLAKNKFPNK
jgi:solute carrier family 35 protein E1